MKKSVLLDQAQTPDGQTMALFERDGEYTIRIGGLDLMSTRQHASEEQLATTACAHLRTVTGGRVLIGGLGFGFTLQAVLAAVPAATAVTVAELIPAVVAWNQNAAYPLAAPALQDARVRVLTEDVAEVIKRHPGSFDSIILDVDNGPAALSTGSNDRLYHRTGLLHARAALRPGGIVGYWSATPAPAFAKLMERVGFQVEMVRSRAHATSGSWHALYFGRKTAATPIISS